MNESIVVKGLLLLSIIVCAFSEGLRQIVGLPVVHVGNAIILVLFVLLMIKGKWQELRKTEVSLFLLSGAAFLGFASIIGLIYGVSPLLYLWSLRRYLIFYCLLADCYLVFEKDDVPFFYGLLNVVIVLHVILTLVQYFVFGIRWDYLNGIFGTQMGGNAGVNILFAVNTCVCFYRFYKREMKWWLLLLHVAWMCYNAVLSEIKFYVLELVAVLVIYTIVTREFKRVATILLSIIAIVYTSILLMYTIYPYFSAFYTMLFLEFKTIANVSHHTNPDSLGRINQVTGLTGPIIAYASQHRPALAKLAPITGLGLGNAELTLNGMLYSEFYLTNTRLWYWDFVLSIVYVEGGVIGLILYNLPWVVIPVRAFLRSLKGNVGAELMKIMACTMGLFIIIYDVSMRNNYGYMMWAFLGITYAALDKHS